MGPRSSSPKRTSCWWLSTSFESTDRGDRHQTTSLLWHHTCPYMWSIFLLSKSFPSLEPVGFSSIVCSLRYRHPISNIIFELECIKHGFQISNNTKSLSNSKSHIVQHEKSMDQSVQNYCNYFNLKNPLHKTKIHTQLKILMDTTQIFLNH